METMEEVVTSAPAAILPRHRPWLVFASSPFRKLWAATTLSLFGDLFSYIAMAWLVVQALPRAILMVVGGAFADRLSSRLTMLGSMGLRAAVVAPLAVLVLTGRVQMWEVYAIAVVFGIVDAFFMPARSSILPQVVADHALEPGNAVLNVTGQAAVVAGPLLAGLVVAGFGTGWAFAADAACFAVGFLFILAMPRTSASAKAGPQKGGGLGGQIVAGLKYAWDDFGIRTTIVAVAVIDFAANGAIGVGLPTLAHGRFTAGAAGLGVLLGAWGVGATAGAIGAGFVPPPRKIGWMIILLCVWLGTGLLGVGLLPSLAPAALTMGLTGVGTGVVNTYGISWLQRRTLPAMQGRVMSLVMLASMGLTPISYAASGVLAQLNPTTLFLIAGAMIVACGLVFAASSKVRSLV